MANHALSRPEGEIVRQAPVPHDRWDSDRLTGSLLLHLSTPEGQFVSPGTGRLALRRDAKDEVVAQQAERMAETPVIPGSGIKGAVRTIFEILSFSCNPFSTRCRKDACCEACSLFGLLGWSGRASFGDAVPLTSDSVRTRVEKVPIPWLPHEEKTQGGFRVYDLREDRMLDRERRVWVARPKELSREVYSGQFQTRLTFWNITRIEFGRLLICMGLGGDDATRFPLRLGGVKYDGKGAAQVSLHRLQLITPRRETLTEAYLQRLERECIAEAKQSEWATKFWEELVKLASTLTKKAP